MSTQKNCQYYVRFQVVPQPIKKGQKLELYFGQFNKIPNHIVHEQDNSRLIVEGQMRVYVNKKNEQIVLDEGFQSLDILQNIKNVRKIKMEFDKYCDTQSVEFLNLIQKIIHLTNLTQEFMIHFVWVEHNDDCSMLQIINLFKQVKQINSLKFKINIDYQNISKSIAEVSNQVQHLSLQFLESVFRKQDKETEYLFALGLSSLKNLQRLCLYCEGEVSFKILKNILSLLFWSDNNTQNNGENNIQEKCMIQFKLLYFSFNLKCLDFIPLDTDLNQFLPQLLNTNPAIKFKIKLPRYVEQHTKENASKISTLLQYISNIFKNQINIIELAFSTGGNSNYIDQNSLDTQLTTIINKSTVQQSQILNTSSSNTAREISQDMPQINVMSHLNFLLKQKKLNKLTLKLDQETNLVDLASILQKNINNLISLNIRIRNNSYTKQQFNKLIDVINQLIYLRFLCLDIQYEEYIFFKLNPIQLNRLILYKQGSMVKRSSKLSMQQIFQNDPIKLFNFYFKFKNLVHFNGKVSGFEYCKDSYKVYLDENYKNHISKTEDICLEIIKKLYFEKKRLIRLITHLQFRLQLNKEQINQILQSYYQF
ncbi:hypothetical protein ABPG74_005447 [Tetrahymena malaccensis]